MIQLKPELLQRMTPLRVQALIEVEFVVQEHACLKSGVHVQHVKQDHSQLPQWNQPWYHSGGMPAKVPQKVLHNVFFFAKQLMPKSMSLSCGTSAPISIEIFSKLKMNFHGCFYQLLHYESGLLLLQGPSFYLSVFKEVNRGEWTFQDQNELLFQILIVILCLFLVPSVSVGAFLFLAPVLPQTDSETLAFFFFFVPSPSELLFLFPAPGLTETSLDSVLLFLSINEKNRVHHQLVLVDCMQ